VLFDGECAAAVPRRLRCDAADAYAARVIDHIERRYRYLRARYMRAATARRRYADASCRRAIIIYRADAARDDTPYCY